MKQSHHQHHEMYENLPEVQVTTTYSPGVVTVKVRDLHDTTVSLAETHEKRMHLVIVSADLETFLHVHPVENDSGDFEVKLELSPGRYLAFADINPVGMTYVIKPTEITVGEETESPDIDWEALVSNDNSTKEIEGKTVTFHRPTLTAEKAATLSFDLKGERPLPYLGALGHVVVLDEQGTRFIHVHPASEEHPIFEAQFPSPGFYKLWAEFKFADVGVLAFPFLVKVDEKGNLAGRE